MKPRTQRSVDEQITRTEKKLAALKERATHKKLASVSGPGKKLGKLARALRGVAKEYGADSEFGKCCALCADEIQFEMQRLAGQLELPLQDASA